ncbi:phosphotransferase [Candidatus Bathyarchaeota archaeon]|nr:phosphotransferase [Candidatus Bathyarchaeota archaeon]
MKIKVLLVDNDTHFHDRFKLRFEPLGFEVRAVCSVREALQVLTAEIFHLAIVDKRLEDDGDMDDIGGWNFIDMLKEVDPTLPYAMLTGFPDESERTDRHDVLYVDKRMVRTSDGEGGFKGTNAIASWFRQNWMHNVRLKIIPVVEMSSLLSDMEFRGMQYRYLSNELKMLAKEEFDLLLRRLFKEPTEQVTLSPFRPGKSGRGLMLAQPDYKLLGVLKCGERNKINREFENYKEHVEPYVPNRTITSKERRSETRSIGAIFYSLVGHSSHNPVTFSEFFKNASADEIIDVLQNLFCDTLSKWYEQAGNRAVVNLSALYKECLELSGDVIARVKSEKANVVREDVSLLTSNGSVAESVFDYVDSAIATLETQRCIQHGDLHGGNIIVDNGSAWLIDFAHTGWSHIFRDIAQLEVSIKMDLVDTNDLWGLLELEKSLVIPDIFATSFKTTTRFANSSKNKELDKAYKVVCALREIAEKVSERKTQLVEYFIALLYTTVWRLQFFDADTSEGKCRIAQGLLACEQLVTLLTRNNVGTHNV